jgi:hypothetical protein
MPILSDGVDARDRRTAPVSTLAVGTQAAGVPADTESTGLSEPFRRSPLRPDPPTGIIGRWVERVRGWLLASGMEALIRPWQVDIMGPSNDEMAQSEGAPINVTRLVVDPKTGYAILAGVVSVLVTALVMFLDLRSEVRDMRTIMESESKTEALQRQLQEERQNNLRSTIETTLGGMKASQDDFKRRQELQQYEIQGLKELFLKFQAERR